MIAVARWLLAAAAGNDAEYVVGDIEEELLDIAATRGGWMAKRWLLGQALRSTAPLLGARIRSGEMTNVLMAGVLAAVVPLWLCHRLWQFVASQIPFKDGTERDAGQLAVNVVVLCGCAAVAGLWAPTKSTAAAVAIAVTALAAATLWLTGAESALYIWLVLIGAPATVLAGGYWRRLR
jgi:hypothetical protein